MNDVKDINEKKEKGTPIENAVNQLKASAANEFNKKFLDQVKVVNNSRKVLKTEIGKLRELEKEIEIEKAEFSELLKEVK